MLKFKANWCQLQVNINNQELVQRQQRRTLLYSVQESHCAKYRNPTQPPDEEITAKNAQPLQFLQNQQKQCANRKPYLLYLLSAEIPALHVAYLHAKTRITRKPDKWFTMQINWLVPVRDELPLKGISEQMEFYFEVFEWALTDNKHE